MRQIEKLCGVTRGIDVVAKMEFTREDMDMIVLAMVVEELSQLSLLQQQENKREPLHASTITWRIILRLVVSTICKRKEHLDKKIKQVHKLLTQCKMIYNNFRWFPFPKWHLSKAIKVVVYWFFLVSISTTLHVSLCDWSLECFALIECKSHDLWYGHCCCEFLLKLIVVSIVPKSSLKCAFEVGKCPNYEKYKSYSSFLYYQSKGFQAFWSCLFLCLESSLYGPILW